MKEIRMHGRGGQGIVVGGEILSNACMYDGKYLAIFPSFGVERRGSPVEAFGRLSNKPVREKSKSYNPDYLLIFEPSMVNDPATFKGFVHGGTIITCKVDPEEILSKGVKPGKIVMVDAIRIAYEITGNNLTNMILCGAFAKCDEVVSIKSVLEAIRNNLTKSFVRTSLEGAQRGYDEAEILTYDFDYEAEEKRPQWERKCLACKKPPELPLEAPWEPHKDSYACIETGVWRTARPVVNEDECIKCGVCAAYCTIQCIKKDGNGYYHADLTYCKGCGVCAHECTRKCIEMKREAECE